MRAIDRILVACLGPFICFSLALAEDAKKIAVEPSTVASIDSPDYLKAAFETLLKMAGTSFQNDDFTPMKCRKVTQPSGDSVETCFSRWGYREYDLISKEDDRWSGAAHIRNSVNDASDEGSFTGGRQRGPVTYSGLSPYPYYSGWGSVGGIVSLSGRNGKLISGETENRLQIYSDNEAAWLSMNTSQLARAQRLQLALLETVVRCEKPEERQKFMTALVEAWPFVLAHPLNNDHDRYTGYKKSNRVETQCYPTTGSRSYYDSTVLSKDSQSVHETLSISLTPQREGTN